MIRRVLLWMFTLENGWGHWERAAKVVAQLALLCLPVLITRLFWNLSNGWAACAGMMLFGGVMFIFTTWYRWNVIEPRMTDAQRADVRFRRSVRRFCATQEMAEMIGRKPPAVPDDKPRL